MTSFAAAAAAAAAAVASSKAGSPSTTDKSSLGAITEGAALDESKTPSGTRHDSVSEVSRTASGSVDFGRIASGGDAATAMLGLTDRRSQRSLAQLRLTTAVAAAIRSSTADGRAEDGGPDDRPRSQAGLDLTPPGAEQQGYHAASHYVASRLVQTRGALPPVTCSEWCETKKSTGNVSSALKSATDSLLCSLPALLDGEMTGSA
ncbi:unnamed protein product [Phytophthora lilii]|uniref:Unnamed protein product n=1 Tax=Phytophthora lilii TaxID=2077276 RepID=A0A9W6WLV0_9STRA|nr:unnamed protein product [Phytophthora lilii]